MCRFVLYKGPPLRLSSLITEPEHSLIHQSTSSREADEPLNGDGFGIAWYNPELCREPAAFRSVTPAWNNRNLIDLARVTRSECILAHIRAATQGQPVTELNCHPFTFGRLAFMHNGDIGGFVALRRRILAGLGDAAFHSIQGTTDSEHLFAMLLDRLDRAGLLHTDVPAMNGELLAQTLEATIQDVLRLAREAGVEEPSYLNIAVADGDSAVACRFTTDARNASSLHLHTGRLYTCDGGVCRMVDAAGPARAVLVSSERLSGDPGWTTIPANHAVIIDAQHSARLRPLACAA